MTKKDLQRAAAEIYKELFEKAGKAKVHHHCHDPEFHTGCQYTLLKVLRLFREKGLV